MQLLRKLSECIVSFQHFVTRLVHFLKEHSFHNFSPKNYKKFLQQKRFYLLWETLKWQNIPFSSEIFLWHLTWIFKKSSDNVYILAKLFHIKWQFSNFSCKPNNFFNLHFNCSNLLYIYTCIYGHLRWPFFLHFGYGRVLELFRMTLIRKEWQ